MKKRIRYYFLFMAGIIAGYAPVQAQQMYKFPVFEEGVYHLSQEQATKWDLGNINEIRILGHPGMLDQKIDSSIFSYKEVPQKIIDNKLYFFLEGADEILTENGSAQLISHTYTDTLYYLLQTGSPGTNPILPAENPEEIESNIGATNNLYQIISHKAEEDNLLSSGREWFGYRTFNGGSHIIEIAHPPTKSERDVLMWAQTMAQSFHESTLTFATNNQVIGSVDISSIPNSRYAIKGREKSFKASFPTTEDQTLQEIVLTYSSNDANGAGYLKNILLAYPFSTSQLTAGIYYNLDRSPFQIETALTDIWDVGNFFQVKELNPDQILAGTVKKIAVFDQNNSVEIERPEKVKIRTELLSGAPEFIIITHDLLYNQAKRLADFKNVTGLSTETVLITDIYDSYGYGNPDLSSIRNFLADYYHSTKRLKNVLFFGKGSFDYKHKLGGRPNLVPIYSSRVSLNPLTTYGSDDYFGFLEIGEGDWLETPEGDHTLKIGIGRIPAINSREAKIAVDKIISYQNGNRGYWKKKLLFVADDGDNNVHLNDSEKHTAFLYEQAPAYELRKLYLDNYQQEETNNQQTATAARETLIKEIKEGVLLLNYIGHGNELNLTSEGLFSVSDIEDWPVSNKLPVMVTATCEFGRHDSPYIRSGAEELLLAEQKGVIAMLTTGRPVFSSINYALNKAFLAAAFGKSDAISLGEIFKETKNNSLNGPLNRNFSLLGDPSLKLDIPLYKASAKEWIEVETQITTEKLSGLNRLEYRGNIEDPMIGSLASQFEGTYEITINGPADELETLGDESPKTTYLAYNQSLFRGTGKVVQGQFSGEVLLPSVEIFSNRDFRINLFAVDERLNKEAFGSTKIPYQIKPEEHQHESNGPEIQLWVADSTLSKASISSRNTPIWIQILDDSGINTMDVTGLTLQINGGDPISLIDQYKAINGTFTSGRVKAWAFGLDEGMNELIITAIDQLGNSTQHLENIEVQGSNQIKIENLEVYPNPASDQVHFKVTHNRLGETISLEISLFSLQGTEIFSYKGRFPKVERSIIDSQWIFLNRNSKNLIKGTYLYNLNLYSEDDATSDILAGKIIIQ
jgi:hypothetical protein